MSKTKKIVWRMIPVMLLMIVFISNGVWGAFSNLNPNASVPTQDTDMTQMISRIWGIILVVLQVAAVAALVFAGVKYMYASADQRAEIKQSLMYLAIGAVLVFGAATVIGFVTEAFDEIV